MQRVTLAIFQPLKTPLTSVSLAYLLYFANSVQYGEKRRHVCVCNSDTQLKYKYDVQ